MRKHLVFPSLRPLLTGGQPFINILVPVRRVLLSPVKIAICLGVGPVSVDLRVFTSLYTILLINYSNIGLIRDFLSKQYENAN